jgi:hypothetical protein
MKLDKYVHIDYNLKELFKYYKSTVKNSVNYAIFVLVIKKFNLLFAKKLYEGAMLKLPNRLGEIYIIQYKPKFKFDEKGELTNKGQCKMIDYKATKELWKNHPELAHKQRVFYVNEHTDGLKLKIKWWPGSVKNINIYNFAPAKSLRRNLAKYIRSNPNTEYYDN